MLDPPPRSAHARFDAGFGQRFLVTVDTEEEFDWARPLSLISGWRYALSCSR